VALSPQANYTVSLNYTLPISMYTTAHIKSSNHTLSLHRLTSCILLYSSSLPLYSGRLLLYSCWQLLTCLLTHSLPASSESAHLWRRSTDTPHRKHVTWRYALCVTSQRMRQLRGQKENTCHMTATYCCVTSRRKKENTASLIGPPACFGRGPEMTSSIVACWNMLAELWPGNGYSRYNI
jgi:hypothetical protein